MSSLFVLFAIFACSNVCFCVELCKNREFWFDFSSAKCKPCKTCGEKAFIMEPCSQFMDTLCVDLKEIGRSIDRNIMTGILKRQNVDHDQPPKWHETEAMDDPRKPSDVPVANAAVVPSVFDNFEHEWGQIVLIVLGLTFFFIFGSIVILTLRVIGRRYSENRKNVARARLFSRDRLNTTEYMNNLATLDRRLAMDEILEKRKKAIFEPQLLHENIYTDEVFVDISGLPRNLHDDHEYDELDHSRCLLRMQDKE